MKVFIFILAILARLIQTSSQRVNNVHLMGHIPYMVSIIQEVVFELESREWCTLKVPDITVDLDETILDHHYKGTVTYSKGFVVSIQHIDILQEGVSQNWSWNDDETGTVHLTATMRIHDLILGYDVAANLDDGRRQYTVTAKYPLISFTFHLYKNVNTEDIRVEILSRINISANRNTIRFLPRDETADVLHTEFNVTLPEDGIKAWADNVFPSITLGAYNKVEFPRICYDCNLRDSMQ